MPQGEPSPAEERAEAAAALPPPKGLRLVPPPAGRWISFPEHPGVRIKVRALTTPLNIAAEARARRRLREIIEADPANQAATDADFGTGVLFTFQAAALAKHLVEEWEGIETADGQVAAVTEDTIAALMQHPDISRAFMLEVRRPLDEVAAEGEG